jgi:hypothetical protein
MMHINYKEQIKYLVNQYEELSGYDFYRYIFPNNENQGELNTDFSKPNAIYLYEDEKDKDSTRRLRRRIMLNDTWKDDYKNYVEKNISTLCSGLSYRNRTNKIVNAQKMNALVFDLDGVGQKELKNLFNRFDGEPKAGWGRTLPRPTFLVSSGSGLHLYYVFNEPIDLYPNIKLQLKSLKHNLTFRMWDYKSTTQNKEIQYQSINQGFRMVGSLNNKYNTVIRAFKIGEKVNLEYLNRYAKEENKVDLNKRFRPSTMSRAEAKEKYPEWYQRVVIDKNKVRNKWHINRNLYDWWKSKAEEIKGGHRYFFLMCMSIYACKCDVSKKELKADMYEVFKVLKDIDHNNPLTKYDIESALEAYDKEYYNFKIEDIEKLTDIRIERNKRNYQKQKDHLEEARAVRDIRMKRQGKKWDDNNGRPSKEKLVKEYIKNHPGENPTQIAKILNISRSTVYKYMK